MTGYVRPAITPREFCDAAGSVIHYGDRWGSEPTPDEAYGVTSNLERFAPLHNIANALIAHFVAVYDVTVSEDAAFAGDILLPGANVVCATKVEAGIWLPPEGPSSPMAISRRGLSELVLTD